MVHLNDIVYKDLIISTIVDRIKSVRIILKPVYKDLIISTIVDDVIFFLAVCKGL